MSNNTNDGQNIQAPSYRNAHGGGYIPNESSVGGSPNSQAPTSYTPSRVNGSGYVATGQPDNNGSMARAHGGGYVPNQQPLQSSPYGNPVAPQADNRSISTGYNTGPASGSTQAYQVQGGYVTYSYDNGTVQQVYVPSAPQVPVSTQQVNSCRLLTIQI